MKLKLIVVLFFSLLTGIVDAQPVGTVTIDRARIGAREIFLMRNNTIVGTYGGQSDPADLGDALVDAVGAAQDGDLLLTGPGLCYVEDLTIDDSVTWIAYGTVCGPVPDDGDWTSLVNVTADDVVLQGLSLDGLNQTNAGSGSGIRVVGERFRGFNIVSNNMDGDAANEGRGIYIAANDCILDGFYSEGCSYTGIRCSNADRLTLKNIRVWNAGSELGNHTAAAAKTMSYDATTGVSGTTMEWCVLENVYGYAGDSDTRAMINFNHDPIIKKVTLTNVQIFNDDNLSAGVSFNTTSREQCAKFQNIDLLVLRDCEFLSGTNSGSGLAVAFAFDPPFPSRVYFTGCKFAGGIWGMGTGRCETLTFQDCDFGLNHVDGNTLCSGLGSGRIGFYRCNFDLRDGVRIFTMSGTTHLDSDYLHLVDCDFVADKASDVYVSIDEGSSDLLTHPRRIIAANNSYTNSDVGGDFLRSDDVNVALLLTTDRNGTIMHDDSDATVADPGAGPSFFAAVPGTFEGQRIINEEWNGSGIQYYFYNGTNWVDGTD